MHRTTWPVRNTSGRVASACTPENSPACFVEAAAGLQFDVPCPASPHERRSLVERAARAFDAMLESWQSEARKAKRQRITEREWRKSGGATLPRASRRAFVAGLVGLTLTAAIEDRAQAAGAGRLRFARATAAPPSGLLYPAEAWDGTAGSGFSAAQLILLQDPVRTGPKMIIRPLQPPEQAFTDDFDLVATATSFDGVDSVEVWCEGNFVGVTERTWVDGVTPDGSIYRRYGYRATLDWSAIQAFGFAEGAMNVYFRAPTPSGSTIQQRVLGPFLYYARNPGVGAGCEYDFSVIVNPAGGTTPGVRYTTIVAALLFCSQQSKVRPKVVLEATARYTTAGNIASAPHTGSFWWTIEPAPGVTATFGNFDINDIVGTAWFCDNLHFKGDIIFDYAAMCGRLGGMWRGYTGSQNKFWCDGIEIMGGSYDGSGYVGGTGSGVNLLYYGKDVVSYFFGQQSSLAARNYYFTHVNMHDMPGYGYDLSLLLLNCDLRNCGGSGLENNLGAMHNVRVSRVGGIQSGARSQHPVFTLAYTGGATLAEIRRPGNNGSLTGPQFYEDNVLVGTFTQVAVGSAAYTDMSDLVTWINTNLGASGWTATANGVAADMAARTGFLSIADLPPSSAIGTPGFPLARRPITSTPLQFTWIADVHSNAITTDGPFLLSQLGIVAENIVTEFIYAYDIVESAHCGANQVKDFCLRWSTFQDVSAAYQIANPTQDPVAACQASIYGGTSSHFLVAAVTYEGPGQQALTQSGTSMDAKSRISRSIFELLSINNVSNRPAMVGVVLRTGSLPSGADALSKTLASAYTESQLFEDPLAALPDFAPKSTQLQLSDLTYAGARVPLAQVSNDNYGWNVDAA